MASNQGDIWERRRRNLRALISYRGMNASQVSKKANLSPNTLPKFLSGENRSLTWESLEKVCAVLEITNPAILDATNPLSDSKMKLFALVQTMSDEQAEAELIRLQELGLGKEAR